jgi:hypothetical protein
MATINRHKHRVIRAEVRCFSGPVKQPQNVAAHGGVTETQHCACGATRKVNVNGRHEECGSWCERKQK